MQFIKAGNFKNVCLITLILLFSKNELFSQTAKTIDLKGLIVDSENKPLSFVSVVLQEISVSTVSDKKGEFLFNYIPEGRYHITFNHTGFESKVMDISLHQNDTVLEISLTKSLIETSVIDVTSSFNPSETSNSTFSITEINPRKLGRIRSQNIASTIQNIPGVNNISTGSSIGKPIIRGLSYQSVLILHDGIKHESQLWGDEHAPEIPLFDIDRIEILRGPSSLIYGSDGIGGVINIITKQLQFSNNDNPLTYGNITLNGFSMDNEKAGNLNLGLGLKKTGIRGYIGYRNGGNMNTPTGEFTLNTPEGKNTIKGGALFNSADEEFQAGLNLGFKLHSGIINASFENLNRQLQLHENPEVNADATPNQKIVTNNVDIKGIFSISKTLELEPVFSYENQSRIEFENIQDKNTDTQALNLDMNLYQANLMLHHKFAEDLLGTAGVSFIFNNNKSLAEEKLIPNYNSNITGIFISENYEKKLFTFSGGIRFDSRFLNIKETVLESDTNGAPLKKINPAEFTFNAFTGSLGFVYKPSLSVDVFANTGTGWRPPSEYELFVDGVHEGTGRFEKGLVTLNPDYSPATENSLNFDLGTRIRNKYITAEISFYNNFINNFVYSQSTGKIDSASGFPVFDLVQDNSSFAGYEYSIQIQPVSWLLISLSGDYVKSQIKGTNTSLPFTPPSKNIVEFKFEKNRISDFYNPYVNFGAKFVSEASQVGELEAASPSYNLLNAGFGFDFALSKSVISIDFDISNLTDTKYADHLSRYRYYAMNAGRSFNLKINIPFQFHK